MTTFINPLLFRRWRRAATPAGLLAIALLMLDAQVSRAQAPLRSMVFPADSARQGTSNANQRSIVDSVTATFAKLELHVTTVAPGQRSHAPHRHAHEELVVIRSGVFEILLGDHTGTARPGDVVFLASNELHGMKNVSDTPGSYLVIRIDPHDLPPDAKQ